jgi:5-methylcytosine-specific restriction endonuclease McrA
MTSEQRKEYLRAYRQMNREKRTEYNRAWASANPGRLEAIREANKEKKRAYDREYRQRNKAKKTLQSEEWARTHPDRLLRRRAAWRERNRENISQYTKAWNQKNPASKLFASHQRRAARVATPVAVTPVELRALKESANGYCAYCLRAVGCLELEHCTPLSRKGRHDLDNLVFACRACNRSKRAKTVLEFCVGLRI